MFIHRDKSDELFYNEFLTESPKLQERVKAGENRHFAFKDLSQDLFTMFYEPNPKDVEQPCPSGLQVAKQAIDQIKELREYKELHQITKLDPLTSGLACTQLSEDLQKMLPPAGPKSEDDLLKEIEICKEYNKPEAVANAQRALEKLAKVNEKASKIKLDEDELRQKMRGMLASAMKAAEEGADACESMGYGKEPGSSKQVNLKEKLEVAKMIGKSKKLKEIAKLAGRFTRIAKKKQMEKSTSHEINSIKTGDNLQRMLPAELSRLGCAATKGLFFKGYLEKTLLEYELGGKEPMGQGPIIVAIDSSGSMAGPPEWASKGIAMALQNIAKKQGRDFIMIQFGSSDQIRTFIAPKGKCDYLPLLVELEFFFSGGTDFERPLNECIGFIKQAKYDRADIIFITDGLCQISPAFEETYNKIKKERAFACIGVLIGAHEGIAIMNKFCDTTFNVSDLLNDGKNDSVHDKIFKI